MERRAFVTRLAGLAAGQIAFGALPAWTARALAAADPDLIERNDFPEHWETSLAALGRSFQTPNDRFFVRSHFAVPDVDPVAWRLEVAGLVERHLSLSLAELRALPRSELTCTLECAGNGRALYALPSTSGTQWERGAVGTARWGGFRLTDLFARAGVRAGAQHVWFECADQAATEETPRFARSIPFGKAVDDALLADTMNGAPLPRLHGAPLRAVVPGWYGMASAKWVTRIRVEEKPSDNHFMVRGYRYNAAGEDPAQAAPVEAMRVKSVITRPLDGARIAPGRVRVEGFAWGGSPVAKVEISSDGGATWRLASFTGPAPPRAWRAWRAEFFAPAGTLRIQARATDSKGEAQPARATPNAGGYGNNSIHEVTLRVGA